MTTSTTVSTATFTRAGPIVAVPGEPSLRCASLLKPVYAWATPTSDEWASLSAAMLTRSDNDATDELVRSGGGLEPLLGRVATLTGVHLQATTTWGRIEVTARQVAALYRALLAAAGGGDPAARAVAALTGRTRRPQRLTADVQWAELTGRPVAGVKAGWDLDHDRDRIRTHVVVLGEDRNVAVLTSAPVDPPTRRRWAALLREHGPEGVLPVHREVAGELLRGALASAALRECGS